MIICFKSFVILIAIVFFVVREMISGGSNFNSFLMIGCPLKFVLLFISEFCAKNQDINKAGNPPKEIPLLKMFIGH